MIDCSIIIVNYNTFALTKNAIESVIDKTDGLKYELIVVDNNSPDGSGKLIKEHFCDNIVFIQSSENAGFGRANNLAIKQAKGRNIFLLNSDTILINNSVKILSDYLDNNPKVGVCGGNLFYEDMSPAHSYSLYFPNYKYKIRSFCLKIVSKVKRQRPDFNYSNKTKEVAYITGADMMTKKEVFDTVGLFDPDFFMYYEETELSFRIKKAGYKRVSVPQAKIIHLESKSVADSAYKQKISLESRRLYLLKTQTRFETFIENLTLKLKCFLNIVFFTIIADKDKANYWINTIKQI